MSNTLAVHQKRYSKRDWLKWLLASLLISLCLQGAAIGILEPVRYDSREYLALSHNLFHGYGYSHDGLTPTRMRQPLYPLFLTATYWAAGRHLLLVQFSQVILNIVIVYLGFAIAWQVFGQELWPGTLLSLGLYLPLWANSAYIMTETLFTLFLALFMFSTLRWLKGGSSPPLRGGLVPGALLGLAILTRPIGFSILPVSLLPIVLRIRPWRRALGSWAMLCVGCALVLLPWATRNLLAFREFTPLSTDGATGLFCASLPQEAKELRDCYNSPQFQFCTRQTYYIEREAHQCFLAQARQNILHDLAGYLLRRVKRVCWVWSYLPGSRIVRGVPLLFWPLVGVQWALLLSALVGLSGIKHRWLATYLVTPALAFTVLMLFNWAETRFLPPAMLYLVLLSGQGIWIMARRFREVWHPER